MGKKKNTPKGLRGQNLNYTILDVASTWERRSLQLKDLEVGKIVYTRQQICRQNANKFPANAYLILSTDTNWYQRRDRVKPVQKEGANGILIVKLNNCVEKWVAGLDKPFVEPLENLVTEEQFKTQCVEKKRLYETEMP